MMGAYTRGNLLKSQFPGRWGYHVQCSELTASCYQMPNHTIKEKILTSFLHLPSIWEGTSPQGGHDPLFPVICIHKDFIMPPALEIRPWSNGTSLRIGLVNSESI